MPRKIYLDVCTLCRPYDDQTYLRVRMETSAVHLILSAVEKSKFKLVWSPVHLKEIEATANEVERAELLYLIAKTQSRSEHNTLLTRNRAEFFVSKGLGIADAAYLAYSESFQAELITCDDKFAKKSKTITPAIWVGNPVAFCEKEELL